MSEREYRITGRVLDLATQTGIPDLRVEAWDKDLVLDDLVGSAMTDPQGVFQLAFDQSYFRELFLDRSPDLFFRVFRGEALVKSTEDSVLWNVASGVTDVVITISLNAPEPVPSPWPLLHIDSFEALIDHEPEILERIEQTTNGGNLFMIHPFMLLADVGVVLSNEAFQTILEREPQLTGLSATPYNALRNSQSPQNVRFHLHGLFER